MKLKEILRVVRNGLQDAGIEEASIESELLVRHACGLSVVEAYLDMEKEVAASGEHRTWQLYRRRLLGEPSAYIREGREFYGQQYYVNNSVLIPRPETELLVERVQFLARGYHLPVIADVGTGSGNIATTLAGLIPQSKIYAIDISAEALGVARFNARRHGVEEKIIFLRGDLLAAMPESADIIAANLPYVCSSDISGEFEPRLALDGGERGLNLIAGLCRQLPGKLNPGGSVLLEIGMGQADDVRTLLGAALSGAAISIFRDLAGIERVVQATLPAG